MPEVHAAIALNEVTASSGGFEILSGTNVAFPEGRCSVVMGAAGSGKSTLLKVAAGLVVPDSGSVSFRGADMARFGRREEFTFRATTGFVFQDAALWADTTILGNVAMPLRVHKRHMGEKAIGETVRQLLARLGYDESLTIRPAELSAGEQKLVSIARAVIHEPSIIFMDDPTSNLDEDAVEKVFSLLDELRKKKRTIIVVANSSDLAFRFADRLGVIKGGAMVAFGTYDDTVSSAEAALSTSLARLRARGSRAKAPADDAGAENSQRGDV
jgi:phospholipid/cholesterol/gamma-HCH transport system ATP-binding protein